MSRLVALTIWHDSIPMSRKERSQELQMRGAAHYINYYRRLKIYYGKSLSHIKTIFTHILDV